MILVLKKKKDSILNFFKNFDNLTMRYIVSSILMVGSCFVGICALFLNTEVGLKKYEMNLINLACTRHVLFCSIGFVIFALHSIIYGTDKIKRCFRSKQIIFDLSIKGFFSISVIVAWYTSISSIKPYHAVVISFLTPLITSIIFNAIYKKTFLKPSYFVCFIIAIIGSYIAVYPQNGLSQEGRLISFMTYMPLMFFIIYKSFNNISLYNISKQYSVFEIYLYECIIGIIFVLTLSWFKGYKVLWFLGDIKNADTILSKEAYVLMAVCLETLLFTLNTFTNRFAVDMSKLQILDSSKIIFAALIANFVFNDPIYLSELIGSCLIVISFIIVSIV